MAFRYLKDPLFLTVLGIYLCSKVLRISVGGTGFQNAYLNDLICVPFWVPILLAVNRRLGLRRHDGPPEAYELLIPILVWSIAFEMVFPYSPRFGNHAVADPNDILCYCAGGLVSGIFWRCYYAKTAGQTASRSSVPPAAGSVACLHRRSRGRHAAKSDSMLTRRFAS